MNFAPASVSIVSKSPCGKAAEVIVAVYGHKPQTRHLQAVPEYPGFFMDGQGRSYVQLLSSGQFKAITRESIEA